MEPLNRYLAEELAAAYQRIDDLTGETVRLSVQLDARRAMHEHSIAQFLELESDVAIAHARNINTIAQFNGMRRYALWLERQARMSGRRIPEGILRALYQSNNE